MHLPLPRSSRPNGRIQDRTVRSAKITSSDFCADSVLISMQIDRMDGGGIVPERSPFLGG